MDCPLKASHSLTHFYLSGGCCHAKHCPLHWEQVRVKCLVKGHNRLGGTANPLAIGQPAAPTLLQSPASILVSSVHLSPTNILKIKKSFHSGILHVSLGMSTDHGRGRDQPKVRGETRRLSTPAQELMPQTSSVKPATKQPTVGRPSPGPLGRTSSRQPAATYSRLPSHSRCLLSCRLELQPSPQASNRVNRPSSAERPKGR